MPVVSEYALSGRAGRLIVPVSASDRLGGASGRVDVDAVMVNGCVGVFSASVSLTTDMAFNEDDEGVMVSPRDEIRRFVLWSSS